MNKVLIGLLIVGCAVVVLYTIDLSSEKPEFAPSALQECNKFKDITTCQYYDGKQKYFRTIQANKIKNYSLTDEFIGSGSYGDVYVGKDMDTGESIAIKRVMTKGNEMACLNLMEMYLGHTRHYILMKKARGEAYSTVLYQKHSTEKFIKMHSAITKKFSELKAKKISQEDPYPRHIFISENATNNEFTVDIIDYGLCLINPPSYEDIYRLNTILLRFYYLGDEFYNYIKKLTRSDSYEYI
ncbi:MAG: hypothetical protein Harvfovirus45_9 [Harvfovirus sp.]|uniref:Protein kinase domain-containing protein n=1 Tax=Harvfovirus sp. TaxID=2487768 RepID=A0A3G5A311_9VIRU|nr:MAG: hypothetical protein Harvfovirus45_9 [Harvfovirus sp.]